MLKSVTVLIALLAARKEITLACNINQIKLSSTDKLLPWLGQMVDGCRKTKTTSRGPYNRVFGKIGTPI